MDEVIAGLLRTSGARPWYIVAFAATVTVGTLALWLGTSSVDRSEVAHDTLLDAQVARIDRLLDENAFDERGKHRLDEEMKALAALDGDGDAFNRMQARAAGEAGAADRSHG